MTALSLQVLLMVLPVLWLLPITLSANPVLESPNHIIVPPPPAMEGPTDLSTSPTISSSLQDAMELLISFGVPKENFCISLDALDPSNTSLSLLPLCTPLPRVQRKLFQQPKTSNRWIRSRRERYLLAKDHDATEDNDEKNVDVNHQDQIWFYITHATCALVCVIVAALAAGLTMGLLSLDPLMLLIKVRAGSTQKEQDQAASLLPIVKQHHLLLVTLLLLNSIANEALPLFLEVLVSPIVAVLLSVTLVLFFGEIIPSAIFTGPNKVEIAAQMVPVVKLVMMLLWPVAYPIAKLLDLVLHDDDQGGSDAFGRGELSALVRIQYEERMAYKKRRKQERAELRPATSIIDSQKHTNIVDNVGALDFASIQAIKASKKMVERRQTDSLHSTMVVPPMTAGNSRDEEDEDSVMTRDNPTRSVSIHLDEVSMVEGALSMKTKMALDVYTPIHRMIAIPYDMLLTEQHMVDIYSSGFSRVPVFHPNRQKPKSVTAICGVLLTKQLIVVNPNENRPLSTLPLSCPRCISPKMNLVNLLNLFQTGRLGHLALVCARPEVGQIALQNGKAVPEAAGLMG